MYLFVELAEVTIYGAIGGVVSAGVIFALAGRWDLWNVWAYAGIFIIVFSFQDLALYRKNPDLLKERYKPSTAGRGQFLVIIGLMVVILHWSVARLDQRFHWSDIIPPIAVASGLMVLAIGNGLFA